MAASSRLWSVFSACEEDLDNVVGYVLNYMLKNFDCSLSNFYPVIQASSLSTITY